MKKHFLAIFFITWVLGLSIYGQVDLPIVSKEGRFTFVPPVGFDKFVLQKQTGPPESGGEKHYTYEQSTNRGYCSITYFDLAGNVTESDRVQRVLDGGRDGAVNAAHATLDSEEKILIDGYPARSVTLHAVNQDKTVDYARLVEIVENSRMHAFVFVSSQAELAKPDIQKFFSSIHIQK